MPKTILDQPVLDITMLPSLFSCLPYSLAAHAYFSAKAAANIHPLSDQGKKEHHSLEVFLGQLDWQLDFTTLDLELGCYTNCETQHGQQR